MGCSHQAMIEVITGHAVSHLFVEELLQCTGLGSRRRSGEDDTLTLLDIHLEVARNIQVFVRGIATLLLLRILHTTIPVRLENELVLLRELHEQVGIAGIHTGLDTIFYLMILTAGRRILMRKLADRAESKERTETQRGSRVSVLQCITDKDAILIVMEHHFLL